MFIFFVLINLITIKKLINNQPFTFFMHLKKRKDYFCASIIYTLVKKVKNQNGKVKVKMTIQNVKKINVIAIGNK